MLPALAAFVTADDVAETTATIDPPTATNQYQTTQLHGWTLKINPAIEAADPDLLAATLNELATQLNAIRGDSSSRSRTNSSNRDLD